MVVKIKSNRSKSVEDLGVKIDILTGEESYDGIAKMLGRDNSSSKEVKTYLTEPVKVDEEWVEPKPEFIGVKPVVINRKKIKLDNSFEEVLIEVLNFELKDTGNAADITKEIVKRVNAVESIEGYVGLVEWIKDFLNDSGVNFDGEFRFQRAMYFISLTPQSKLLRMKGVDISDLIKERRDEFRGDATLTECNEQVIGTNNEVVSRIVSKVKSGISVEDKEYLNDVVRVTVDFLTALIK